MTCSFKPEDGLATGALALMAVVPLVEMALRPMFGTGIPSAPQLVQHLGLVLAMFGALYADRGGHLTSLGAFLPNVFTQGLSALVLGLLAWASFQFVWSERDTAQTLSYGLPIWAVQAAMPVGFFWLTARHLRRAIGGATAPQRTGIPIFVLLGGLTLLLFWLADQPIAAIPLSHYQITVNPSLPALPLFTLAGLMFAHSGAAKRLGDLLVACSGGSATGTAISTALLCSFFTAFTGGSGVTILALGGLLLPLLISAGFPRQQGMGLVTSASALGVLLAPSVPLLMYAILARIPINDMFVAGLLPAMVMVFSLLLFGGYMRQQHNSIEQVEPVAQVFSWGEILRLARLAIWELCAPLVAIGALVSGIATPTESAALTAAYAFFTQAVIHRELDWQGLRRCLTESAQIIGGVMLILGMALGLTNYLVDAGIPDLAVEWVQSVIPNRWVFLLVLNLFLLVAGAFMEIFAAIVVLVPLLLPVALSYGIDPVHFGIIFLANLEMGFLCPPAGMNLYFASAMFASPIKTIAKAVLPALFAIFIGALLISGIPWLSTWHLPN